MSERIRNALGKSFHNLTNIFWQHLCGRSFEVFTVIHHVWLFYNPVPRAFWFDSVIKSQKPIDPGNEDVNFMSYHASADKSVV